MSTDLRNTLPTTFRVATAALMAVLLATAAACGAGKKAPAANRSDLRVGVASDVVDWDPHTSTTLGDQQILENIYRGLTVVDPRTKQPAGELAESWTTSPDKLTWTFKLRPTAKFSTGAPVTAKDVKYSIDRILDPATKATAASDFEEVKQVGVVDDRTVRFQLKKPYALLPVALQTPAWAAIIPDGSAATIATKPVGAGPYALASKSSQESVVLKRSPGYWQPSLAKVGQVTFRIIPDENSRVAALSSGQIDLAASVPMPLVKQLQKNSRISLQTFQSSQVNEFGMNAAKAPFSDVRVRQAVAYALNKTDITKAATFGLGGPADTMISPASPVKVNVKGIPYDVASAKRLLAQAGYAKGFDLTFAPCGGTSFPDMARAGEVIASELNAVGIRAHLVSMDAGVWADKVITKGDYQAFVCGLVSGLDPDGHTYRYFTRNGAYNFSHYKGPAQLDKLLEQGRQVSDPAQRAQIYTDASNTLAKEVPWVPLYWVPGVVAMAKNVRGFAALPELNLRMELVSIS
jgi:peptide/nickel transport system substrate-binding protein